MAAELHEVGAVEAGPVDPHQHLALTGLGIRPLLDVELRVGRDHEGLHAPTVLLVGDAWAGNYRALVPAPALAILDDDGEEVLLDAEEAANLFALDG